VSKEFVEPSKPIWQVLICEVSITGKQTTNFIAPLFATYLTRERLFKTCKLDRLICGRVVEECRCSRMLLSFQTLLLSDIEVDLFHLVCVIGKRTRTIFVAMAAVLKEVDRNYDSTIDLKDLCGLFVLFVGW